MGRGLWASRVLETYCSLETTPANHNRTDLGVNIRRFDPNPGVLIRDNDYKARQGSLNVQGNKVRGRKQD